MQITPLIMVIQTPGKVETGYQINNTMLNERVETKNKQKDQGDEENGTEGEIMSRMLDNVFK
jgi:hypothetical protein